MYAYTALLQDASLSLEAINKKQFGIKQRVKGVTSFLVQKDIFEGDESFGF